MPNNPTGINGYGRKDCMFDIPTVHPSSGYFPPITRCFQPFTGKPGTYLVILNPVIIPIYYQVIQITQKPSKYYLVLETSRYQVKSNLFNE